jgi:DNA-binding protein H-NS
MTSISNIDLSKLSNDEMKELQKQLEQESEEREQQQFEHVAKQYRDLAASIGMKPEEVVMGMQRGGKRILSRKAIKNIKFQNPDNRSQTWTGLGKRPNWLVEKLESGAKLNDFKI